MKKATKFISFIMAAAVLLSLAVACTNNGGDPVESSGEPGVGMYGNVPVDDRYDGREFTIATYIDGNLSNGWACYFDIDEPETGDRMQVAAHDRNLEIETKFGVKITCEELWHWFGNKEGYLYMSELAMSDDVVYDLFFLEPYIASSDLIIDGLLYDMSKLPYINLDADYYNHSYNDTYELGGKRFILASDMTYPCQSSQRMYVNIDLLKDLNYDENYVYDMVDDGTWTYEKVVEMITGQNEDLNQDGRYDANDYYGFAGTPYSAMSFYHGSGIKGSYIDSDGWHFDYDSDRAVKVIDTIYTFVNKPEVYVREWTNEIFNSGHALFTTSGSELREIRNWDLSIHIGVVPNPKFDDAQDRYYSYCAGGGFCVPADPRDPDFTGAMIEAMSYGSGVYLVPAFYDNFIEQRVLQDEHSRENWRRMLGEWGFHEFAGLIAPNEEVRYYNPATKAVDRMSTGEANTYSSAWAEVRDVMQLVCDNFYRTFMSAVD